MADLAMNSMGAGSDKLEFFPRVRSVLCLGAHADDIEIGCGGSLLRLIEEQPGVQVHWVVFSGDARRREEARQSANRFLASARQPVVEVLEFPDGYFPTVLKDLKNQFFAIRDRCEPDLVFTHRLEDRHQDHRCLAELSWQTFRNHMIWEYEIPKYEGDLGQPNLFIALSKEVCQRKIEILLHSFPSQADKSWFDAQSFEALLKLRGIEAGGPARLAEAFTARKIVL